MKRIALEEHFVTEELYDRYSRGSKFVIDPSHVEYVLGHTLDIGEQRLRDMDENGITTQVLSLRQPGIQAEPDAATAVKAAQATNDYLAGRVAAHPGRFAGFAVLPLQDPAAAADELERAVRELGLRGAMINGHSCGRYLDHKDFWPVYERAQALGVPLYLHPVRPQQADELRIFEGHPELLGPSWGFAFEAGTHALRLLFSGVFDAFPRFNLILGHMGENIPYMAWRLNRSFKRASFGTTLRKEPLDYLRENFYITTSGHFSDPALLCAVETVGIDRVLFAVDYPFELNSEGVEFIDNAPISDEDRAKICHRNAEALLKL
ncbi:2,3-dihydroxybenzoate decarboxylase [Amycolatopsis sacchari]|uniref:2,3-dihydroxybenzoate decarboxylase n=1 Tax=Amycolatopsis sacchari TaxID=115433 RepID=A0A1I3WH85_9PSEU|nr:amidohydrolase family protein [Amycolatopsis sacchari]SFK06918.1 2,3-dihydroxybenzoate decarboxylase [Amycolatopsis sacchari]